MNNIDIFLVHYGLTAVFLILLIKTIGVPVPPDLIILTVAARSAQGKLISIRMDTYDGKDFYI